MLDYSVIQRQLALLRPKHTTSGGSATKKPNLTRAQAYDIARKEYYTARHLEEVEQRVAREEALATGAYFNKGPLEIGMGLEDKQFEDWKAWAIKEVERERQIAGSAYSGNIDEEVETAAEEIAKIADGASEVTTTTAVVP